MPEWVRIVLSGFFTIWGIRQLWVAGVCLVRALDSATWPCVRGKVIAAEVISAPSGEGGERPHIVYEYTVRGHSLIGECIAFGLGKDLYSGSSFVRYYLERYPLGGPVYVFYDPVHIDRSVLEPGMSLRAFYPLFWAFLMLGGAAMVAFAHFTPEE